MTQIRLISRRMMMKDRWVFSTERKVQPEKSWQIFERFLLMIFIADSIEFRWHICLLFYFKRFRFTLRNLTLSIRYHRYASIQLSHSYGRHWTVDEISSVSSSGVQSNPIRWERWHYHRIKDHIRQVDQINWSMIRRIRSSMPQWPIRMHWWHWSINVRPPRINWFSYDRN